MDCAAVPGRSAESFGVRKRSRTNQSFGHLFQTQMEICRKRFRELQHAHQEHGRSAARISTVGQLPLHTESSKSGISLLRGLEIPGIDTLRELGTGRTFTYRSKESSGNERFLNSAAVPIDNRTYEKER